MEETLLDEPRVPRLSFLRQISSRLSRPVSHPPTLLTQLARRMCCGPGTFLAFCFCCCGVGVALPWTALRMGVSYFRASYSNAIYPRLFCLYYLMQAFVLLLQCKMDRIYDLKYGASFTYTVRLCVSVGALAALLAVFPLAATSEGALYALTALIGIFDACAFGSCACLFSSIKTTNASGFYFLGSSLSSLLSIALSYATGFTALSAAPPPPPGGGPLSPLALPAPLYAFYATCATATLGALGAVLAMLFSKQGKSYLLTIDDSLLESAPLSPRAIARRPQQRSSPLHSWGLQAAPSSRGLLRVPSGELGLQGSEGGSLQAAGEEAGEEAGGGSSGTPLGSNLAIFWQTLQPQLAIFFIWAGTTAVDSLISYFPSDSQRASGGSDGLFTVTLLYASLGGELCGKLSFLAFGARRVRSGSGEGAGGGSSSSSSSSNSNSSANGSSSESASGVARESRSMSLLGEEESEEELYSEGLQWASLALGEDLSSSSSSGAGPHKPVATVPCISSTRVLLALALARTAACLPFYLLIMQQLFGPPRAGGALLRGWFYSNPTVLVGQFVFDLAGAFLSSMTYTLIPHLIEQHSNRTQASAILNVTLTLGTFFGLGFSILSSSFLPAGN
jgi:hypothetical protein